MTEYDTFLKLKQIPYDNMIEKITASDSDMFNKVIYYVSRNKLIIIIRIFNLISDFIRYGSEINQLSIKIKFFL